jgi:hypothetical protein
MKKISGKTGVIPAGSHINGPIPIQGATEKKFILTVIVDGFIRIFPEIEFRIIKVFFGQLSFKNKDIPVSEAVIGLGIGFLKAEKDKYKEKEILESH